MKGLSGPANRFIPDFIPGAVPRKKKLLPWLSRDPPKPLAKNNASNDVTKTNTATIKKPSYSL